MRLWAVQHSQQTNNVPLCPHMANFTTVQCHLTKFCWPAVRSSNRCQLESNRRHTGGPPVAVSTCAPEVTSPGTPTSLGKTAESTHGCQRAPGTRLQSREPAITQLMVIDGKAAWEGTFSSNRHTPGQVPAES